MGKVSKWKTAFEPGGLAALKLVYKGAKSYLSLAAKQKIIAWLIEQETWDVSEVETHLIEEDDGVFQSRQSDYQLLKVARITWHSGEQTNPRQNQELISKKNQALAAWLKKYRKEIEAESLIVYIINECHLLWGKNCGYLWNLIKSPRKIPRRCILKKDKLTMEP